MSPETAVGILGALRSAEAGAAADAPGAFVAFPGCPQLYASLLGARAAPAGAAASPNPGPNTGGWAVPAAAAAALAEVYSRAQAVLGRHNCHAGACGGGRAESKEGGGGAALDAAVRVLEAARDGQAVARLCRCLEDCAADTGAGVHLPLARPKPHTDSNPRPKYTATREILTKPQHHQWRFAVQVHLSLHPPVPGSSPSPF